MPTTESVPDCVERSRVTALAVPWRLAAMSLIGIGAYLPLVSAHARQLWLRPHYQFFPLVLVGAVILFFSRLKGPGPLSPGSGRWSAVWVSIILAVTTVAVLLNSSWLGTVALLATLAVLAFSIGGSALLRRLLPAWGFLWLAVPPPFELDRELILSLQTFTTQLSSRVLDLLGIWHVMSGHVVEIGGRRLLVEEACSGIHSLFSILAATLFFVLWVRRPPVRAICLVLSAVVWVLLGNVVRVVAMTTLYTTWRIDLTHGWMHHGFGLLLFGATLLLIWSSDRFVEFLVAPPARSGQGERTRQEVETQRGLPDLRRTWLYSWTVAGAYLIFIVAQRDFIGLARSPASSSEGGLASCLESLQADTMAAQWGRWYSLGFATNRRNPGSAFGEFSKSWQYQLGQNTATLSFDYPFPGWHDLTRCYTSLGWTIHEQRVVEEAPDGVPARYVEVKMMQPGSKCAYLLFSQLDGLGSLLEPRRGGTHLSAYRHAATLRRWRNLWSVQPPSPPDAQPPIYQFQLLVETYTPLSAAEESEAQAFFRDGLRRLRRQWINSP